MRKFGARLVVAVALMLGGGAATFGVINAGAVGPTTTFVVDDANDAGLGSGSPTACQSTDFEVDSEEVGTCTLRAAIEASENLGTDTIIDLPPPSSVPNNANTQYSVSSGLGQLDIGDDGNTVTITPIDGADQTTNIISAACGTECTPNIRVFKVDTGTTADISGVTVTGGHPSGGIGGGILNCGNLNLSDSTVTENTATSSGGGIENSESGAAVLDNVAVDLNTVEDGDGGGGVNIEASSSMTIQDNSTVSNNSIQDSGFGGGVRITGGDGSTTSLDIEHSTVSDNTASEDGGGGIAVDAVNEDDVSLTLNGDTISDNTAGDSESGDAGGGLLTYGGGGANADATITDSTFSDNSTSSAGGGIAIEDPGTVKLSGDTLTGNTADVDTGTDGEGGGFYTEGVADIDIEHSSFTGDNTAYDGGGIAIEDYNTFTINDSSITGNSVAEGGGGIYDDNGGTPALNVTNSTISANTATATSGEEDLDGDGGGFLDDDCSPVDMTNDTIAGNVAAENGGGFDSEDCNTRGEVRTPQVQTQAHAQGSHVEAVTQDSFTFDTFDHNSASEGGGGNIQQDDGSNITLANSIVANGVVGTEVVPTTNCVLEDGFSSLGYNLIDDNTCGTAGTGDIIGQPAQLGALANNSGQTAGDPTDASTVVVQTEAPNTGSPAINGVPAAVCTAAGVTTDERGQPRPGNVSGTCTIGAYEPQVAPPPPPPAFNPNGYRMAAYDGGVFDFGIQYHGSLANVHLNAPIIGIANNPGPDGYLLVASDGGVFALGGANFFGSLGGQPLTSPIAAIAATPDGGGYWLASQRGTIYNYGDAPKLPAVVVPNGDRIVGIASTNDGKGLWLTDNSGDVYTQGDAQYLGSLGGQHLNAAIVGIAAAATGQGYILAAADGGVFAFGVGFFGSVPGVLKPGHALNEPIVGIAETHSGNGYWEVGADGGVFCFGDAPFLGSLYTQLAPGQKLNGPIIGIQHLGAAPAA